MIIVLYKKKTLTRRQQPNFIPVIDGDFVPMDPAEMWNRSAAANKDFIAGTVIHEGGRYVLPNINGNDI